MPPSSYNIELHIDGHKTLNVGYNSVGDVNMTIFIIIINIRRSCNRRSYCRRSNHPRRPLAGNRCPEELAFRLRTPRPLLPCRSY